MDGTWILAAFVFGLAARLLNLPPLVGFLVAGFVLHGLGTESDDLLEALRDLGVTLLLFTIGLKLRISNMLRPEIWAGASIHMGLTAALLTGVLLGLGALGLPLVSDLDLGTAALVAFALSFSSTVFAVKVLDGTGDSGAFFGRTAIGILIMQDVLAVIFMQLADEKVPSFWALGLLLLLPGRRIFYWLLEKAGHGEMLILLGAVFALGVGHGLFEALGIKGDFGALLVGVLLAPHAKAGELYRALMGLKDLFLVAFFLEIGISGGLDPGALGVALILTPLVLLKCMLYVGVLTRMRMRAHSALRTTLTLANYSEFGLIVAHVAVQAGWLDSAWLVVLALAVSLTFVLFSPLSMRSDRVSGRIAPHFARLEAAKFLEEERPLDAGGAEIVVVGMGRVGTGAYDEAQKSLPGRVIGIDRDAATVAAHREAGRNVLLGDISEGAFPTQGARNIRFALLAIDDHAAALRLTALIRKVRPDVEVVGTVRWDDEGAELDRAGAQTVCNLFTRAGVGLAHEAIQHEGPPRPGHA
jgi:predicted Kef-type K+ transport protein